MSEATEPPLRDGGVRIDAAIAEKRPVPPCVFDQRPVAGCHQHLRIGASLHEVAADRIADERIAEKLQTIGARLRLEPDPVGGRHEHTIGDRVGALRRAPRVDLRGAEGGLFRRMPSDRESDYE